MLLDGYVGPLDVSGFQGGKVTYYDLVKGKKKALGTIAAQGVLPISSFDAVTALPLQYMPNSGRSDTDMYVFDTANPLVAPLTSTPTVDETAP